MAAHPPQMLPHATLPFEPHESPGNVRVFGKPRCQSGFHRLVAMNRDAENLLLTTLCINMVAAANTLQRPPGPLQLSAKLGPSDRLHTASSTT